MWIIVERMADMLIAFYWVFIKQYAKKQNGILMMKMLDIYTATCCFRFFRRARDHCS